ncbi:hypothetical protein [Rickettsia endosymbiont of Halotydeus destructor]|uniref:hypothetical protein n=1 Tax=Rickettsia endosymbiont of Halotydeus destructor TaxID=2996754 RepID=UPI003BB18068
MKKIFFFTILVCGLLTACTNKNTSINNDVTAAEAREIYEVASSEEKKMLFVVGAKEFLKASDEALIEYYKAYNHLEIVTKSPTASAAQKKRAEDKFDYILNKIMTVQTPSTNPYEKLDKCSKLQIMEDIFLISRKPEHDQLKKLLSLPDHRAACVIRYSLEMTRRRYEIQLKK